MGAIITTPISLALSVLSTRPSDVVFWIKWIVSYICIQISRNGTKRRFDLYDMNAEHDPVKVDFISAPEEIALELPLEEQQLQTRADEVFIYGVNAKSECLIVRIARGCNNEADAFIYLKLKNGKEYKLKKTSGFQQSCTERNVFSCGDLQLHYLTPMRRWRIFFNGLLKETSCDVEYSEKMVHVKFAFLWRASSDVFDFTTDINAVALARGLAKARWTEKLPSLEKINNALDFYTQSGTIAGTIAVEGTELEDYIYLFGERQRFTGDTSLVREADFYHILGHVHKDGSFIHLSNISVTNIVENLMFGYLIHPTGFIKPITTESLPLEKLVQTGKMKNKGIKFRTEEESYGLVGSSFGEEIPFHSRKSLEGRSTMMGFKFEMNSFDGSGLVVKGKCSKFPKSVSVVTSIPKTIVAEISYVASFSEKICQDSSVTGGKGSSLGKLTEISKELKSFIVPNGLVVTTAAYELFLTKQVKEEIHKLENVLYGNVKGDVKSACQRVTDEIVKSNILDQILHSIVNGLHKVFPDKDILKFAIRSSATGEDTEQMSAAGQMDTFLGVSGLSEILSAVKKCWASQFSHIAVEYKRQNGQLINSPMAVVIQKMIPCDVAGVLFTCDPLTGNPTVMSITANYGLGESVVSASEEPDTIELKRDFDDKLSLKNKIIGAKSRRIVLQDEEGTNVEEVSEEEKQTCCLSDEMLIQLGNLAVKIEKYYRSHRDIEWGFWKNKLYIFQSRPVTSGSGETNFEIEHEFDPPMRVENEYFTMSNAGEVMPGAMTPLTVDAVFKYIRISFQKEVKTLWHSPLRPRYYPKGIITMCNHAMFYLCDFYEHTPDDEKTRQVMALSIFGREINDKELYEMIKERYGKPKEQSKIAQTLGLFKTLKSKKALLECLKKYEKYRIPIEKYKTASEMLNAMLYACSDIADTMTCHMVTSETSTLLNMFILKVLLTKNEITADVFRNFAKITTTSKEVESADVPAAIESLASYIAKEMEPETFKKMDTKDIIDWLKNSQTVAGTKFKEFLTRHGHRCLREFELRVKPWGTDPTTLIQLLKSLVGNAPTQSSKRKDEDFNKTLSNLGFNLNMKTKLWLKFLVPQSRKAVQNREISKSLVIKALDAWRKGYHRLAELMVSEGRIPDEDLLFFMTLDEIKDLIDTRSPKIISRAKHRRRHYPVVDKYLFPEIMSGYPRPINEDNVVISNEENFSMTGTPVSPGTTKAFVRVALTIEEADSLKPGEILLTYSTDIGWTPYFPILAGVVTEIGGLISHGSVISREYGIPCIAGLHGATRQFKTGDFVYLDGNKGILQRLSKSEQET